jgi:hypothetical protein
MRWQSHHIITTSSLYSYLGGLYRHVHLFGGPDKIHMHSSLIRITTTSHDFLFGYLTKLHHYLLSVTFYPLQAARSSLVVLSLGGLKGLKATPRIPSAPTSFLGKCLENLQYTLVIACRNAFPKER